MKILKKILIILLVIIAIPLIVALFVPKEFASEREIIIDKSQKEVFDYVKFVKNQDNFGVWQLSDPNMKTTSEGTDGTVGFEYIWDSAKLDKGSQTITGIKEGERVETELYFGFGEPAKSYFILSKETPNQTKVKWGVSGKSPYPWNLMSLFYDMGDDFAKGLENLKEIVEKQEVSIDEKGFVLNYYNTIFDELKQSVSGMNHEQLHFKSGEDSWSISQCLEHIVITENMILGMIEEAGDKPENPEKRRELKLSDKDVMEMVVDRSEKYKAPEMLVTKGKYNNPDEALQDLGKQRKEIFSFIEKQSLGRLRNTVIDSPTGVTDAYQSLLFLAGHTKRHTLQIEEIKTNSNFPK